MAQLLQNLLVEATLHPLITALLVMGAGCLLLPVTPLGRAIVRLWHAHGRLILITASVGLITAYLAIVSWYLLLPGFAEEVEPMIASVSWLVQQGHPLYHDLNAPERYSVLYGPSAYLTNGLFLKILGPSIFSAKLAGVLATCMGLIFFFLALAKTGGRQIALIFCGLAALFYWLEGPYSYISRPDPFLLAGVSFALLCAIRGGPVLAVLGTATALGYCVNLKIHAFLFFVPILALLHRRLGRRAVLLSAGGGTLLALVPFLFDPLLSVRNYTTWLREATRHGLDYRTFWLTLRWSLFLALPPVVLLSANPRLGELYRSQKALILSLLGSGALLLVVASKPGAGFIHMMPLIPLILYLTMELLLEARRRDLHWPSVFEPMRLNAALALGVVALFVGFSTEFRCVKLIQHQVAGGADVKRDIDKILKAYPDLTIGMACGGEGRAFGLTSFRPLLTFAGQPVLFDIISVMECDFAGRRLSRQTCDALLSGQTAIWLVPRGKEPFAKANWYRTSNPLFPESFRSSFLETYQCRDHSRYFDLWFHNEVSPGVGSVLNQPAAHIADEPAT